MIHQLRMYEIFEHNKSAFHDRFGNHATRITKTYGFDILAMWGTKKSSKSPRGNTPFLRLQQFLRMI